VPHLAALLDSASPDIRYDAVSGLAAFANNFPIQDATNFANMGFLQSQGATVFTTADTMKNFPGVTAFHQQESVYLEFWKAWWITNRSKIEALAR